MRIVSLPYSANTPQALTAISDLPLPVWLDSGRPRARSGRFDIISADPVAQLSLTADCPDPFVQLDDLMCELAPQDMDTQMPFCGGAIGYAGYELGNRGNFLPPDTRETPLPAGFFGLYTWALIVDHQLQATHLVFHPACAGHQQRDLTARFQALDWSATPRTETFKLTSAFRHEFTRPQYEAQVARVLQYIRAGDIYQANFTQRFFADCEGDPLAAYLALREAAAGPFSAYLSLPQGQILSLSPERFIHGDGDQLQTEPIKGTARRHADPQQDAEAATRLASSSKDRAENLMIVDLLRNDFGKVCKQGSVRVPELFAVQSFANVHHLVSTITGQLPGDVEFAQVLDACFPGGSITGAPKRRAMEIIRELELSPRGIYCGSIGYLSSCGRADSNIAIRTLTASRGKLQCAAGGGIVADSDPAAEHQECLDKVRLLLHTLEATFRTHANTNTRG
ncbi:aminodeoxychorismate synthase component I [uncultured Microbulbifer sp.]|uniref:aminodeoxychorismate synthase component I n=1 Tax=uncultured Microbulbifer sp. TaxID=348147 RepID=UPI0025D96BA6|nr:aminodeoxychorismate synthase component I [uncultured Microbulbifer sp.]